MKKNIKEKIKSLAIPYEECFREDMKDPKFRKLVEAKRSYFETLLAMKKTREAMGLTQEKLASLAGVPRRTIVRIESGQKNTTVDTLISIAFALGKGFEMRLK